MIPEYSTALHGIQFSTTYCQYTPYIYKHTYSTVQLYCTCMHAYYRTHRLYCTLLYINQCSTKLHLLYCTYCTVHTVLYMYAYMQHVHTGHTVLTVSTELYIQYCAYRTIHTVPHIQMYSTVYCTTVTVHTVHTVSVLYMLYCTHCTAHTVLHKQCCIILCYT
jgi:hypothetical protein